MLASPHMQIAVDGAAIVTQRHGCTATHAFGSAAEAQRRAAFVGEALGWVGTPFRDCCDIKGPQGCVDCAMLLVRAAVDSGLLAPFDPRPYAPRWHQHRGEEKFLDWIVTRLGAVEVADSRFGDVVVWQFGRCFSHGAIRVGADEVVHAYYAAGVCLISRLDEPLLACVPWGNRTIRRPVKHFSLWAS